MVAGEPGSTRKILGSRDRARGSWRTGPTACPARERDAHTLALRACLLHHRSAPPAPDPHLSSATRGAYGGGRSSACRATQATRLLRVPTRDHISEIRVSHRISARQADDGGHFSHGYLSATFLIWQVRLELRLFDGQRRGRRCGLDLAHRDHDPHSISASFTSGGGHFSQVGWTSHADKDGGVARMCPDAVLIIITELLIIIRCGEDVPRRRHLRQPAEHHSPHAGSRIVHGAAGAAPAAGGAD